MWEERHGRRSTDSLGNANSSRYVIGKLRQGAAWECLLFPLCLHVCHAKNDAVWTLYNAWLCPRGQEPESRSIRTARALSQGLRKLPGGAACPCLAAQPDFSPVPAREQRGASPCREPCCDSLAVARAATRETWQEAAPEWLQRWDLRPPAVPSWALALRHTPRSLSRGHCTAHPPVTPSLKARLPFPLVCFYFCF